MDLLGARGVEVTVASPATLVVSGFWLLPFNDWFRLARLPISGVLPRAPICLPALEWSLDGLLPPPVDVVLERFPTGLVLLLSIIPDVPLPVDCLGFC